MVMLTTIIITVAGMNNILHNVYIRMIMFTECNTHEE